MMTDNYHAEPRSPRRTDWTADFADTAGENHDDGLKRKEREEAGGVKKVRSEGMWFQPVLTLYCFSIGLFKIFAFL